jgi:phage-related protein
MGINPTQPNFKSFTFDGTNSRTYGVYITGEGVFNAPERNVEMIDIAGRNGAIALDKGNFLNIEVTYPASIATDNATDFAQAVSDLRNFLCSKVGYVRLEDDYNPNEYRLAIYKSGLEVSHDMLTNGNFEIVFDCKPQRFLTSGETAISVASGGKVTNPTYFDAQPLIELTGYGNANIGGYEINIIDDLVGDVRASNAFVQYSTEYTVNFPNVYINIGDLIDVGNSLNKPSFYFIVSGVNGAITNASISNVSGYSALSPDAYANGDGTYSIGSVFDPEFSFSYGTSLTHKEEFDLTLTDNNNATKTYHVECGVSYEGKRISFYMSAPPNDLVFRTLPNNVTITCGEIIIHSTATTFGQPTYIDCETGEAYTIVNDVYNSLNSYVALGSELPALPNGETTITYDNTFTSVKVTPRWWKV